MSLQKIAVTVLASLAIALPAIASADTMSAHSGLICPQFTSSLARGAHDGGSGQVTNLQNFLTVYFNLDENITTGYFGPLTQKYLKQFQAAQGLDQVGVLGPKTRIAISGSCGGGSPVQVPTSSVDNPGAPSSVVHPPLCPMYNIPACPTTQHLGPGAMVNGCQMPGTCIDNGAGTPPPMNNSVSATIDASVLTSTASTRIISGSAVGTTTVTVLVYSQANPDQLIYSNKAVTVVENGWSIRSIAYSPGTYTVEVHTSVGSPSSANLLAHANFSVASVPVTGVLSASIDASVFSSTAASRVISGSATGASTLTIVVYSQTHPDQLVYRNTAVPVVEGGWTINPGTLSADTYTVEVHQQTTQPTAATLLTSGNFTVATLAPMSASIDASVLSSTGTSRVVSGLAAGTSALTVLVYSQSNPDTMVYRNTAVPVVEGGWSVTPGTLAAGNYVVEVHSQTLTPSSSNLLTSGIFTVSAAAVTLGSASATIDAASLSSTAAMRTITGTANGVFTLTVIVYSQVDSDTISFRSDTVGVNGGAWSVNPGTLAPGTYTVEVHRSSSQPNATTLLTYNSFTVRGSSMSPIITRQ